MFPFLPKLKQLTKSCDNASRMFIFWPEAIVLKKVNSSLGNIALGEKGLGYGLRVLESCY